MLKAAPPQYVEMVLEQDVFEEKKLKNFEKRG